MKPQWLISLSHLVIVVAGIATLTSQAHAGRLNAPASQPRPRSPIIHPVETQPPVRPQVIRTTVRCLGAVTVAEKNGRIAPVIVWSTDYFGPQYSPETRCQMVSPKLNRAVQANGGRFRDMVFAAGTVNGEYVICALWPGQYACNSSNMLFTLKPENRPRVRQILEELTNFGVTGSSSIVEDQGEGVQVDISDLDQELEGEGVAPSDPSQPSLSEPQSVPQAMPDDGGDF